MLSEAPRLPSHVAESLSVEPALEKSQSSVQYVAGGQDGVLPTAGEKRIRLQKLLAERNLPPLLERLPLCQEDGEASQCQRKNYWLSLRS